MLQMPKRLRLLNHTFKVFIRVDTVVEKNAPPYTIEYRIEYAITSSPQSFVTDAISPYFPPRRR